MNRDDSQPLRRTLLPALTLLVGWTSPSLSAPQTPRMQSIIVLVDRSDSTDDTPHAQEVVISHLLDLSRLRRGGLTLAFIFFSDSSAEVVAGDDGLPAPASEPLRKRCFEQLQEECRGGTPLPMALEAANNMLKNMGDENVTVLCLSDGVPTMVFSPDLFPPVKTALDANVEKAMDDGGQDAVDEYWARLSDPNSEEAMEIFQVQQPFVKARCIEIAKATNHHNPRFVSLAFRRGLADFREIHLAAGGSEDDYVESEPMQSLRSLHKVNLVEHIFQYPVIELDATDEFKQQKEFPLAGLLHADAVVTAQFPSTQQFEKLAKTGFLVNGQRHATDAATGQLVVARDSEKLLSTISVLSPPAQTAQFGFSSPKKELAFPGVEIYRWVDMPEECNIICRPRSMDADAAAPFEVNQAVPEDWLVGLQHRGDGVPLEGGEIIFKHTETGEQHLLTLQPDSQFQNLWLASKQELAQGTYSIVLHLRFLAGIPVSTTLEKYFTVVGVEEKVAIEVGESSFSVDRVDFGKIGDERMEGEVTVTLHSDTPHDLPLRVRVLDLKDAEENAIGEEWVTMLGEDLILPAGQSIDVTFRCELPEHPPEGIVDGVVTGILEIVNADSLQPVTIEPLIDGVGTAETLCTVRFTLKRPTIAVTSPRAWRDLITTDDDGPLLNVNANVSFPYGRRVVLKLSTDSEVARELHVRLSRLHDESGAVSDMVNLLADEQAATSHLTIEPGQTATYRLPFSVREALARGYGKIIISGEGVQPVVLRFDVGSSGEHGDLIRYIAAGLATVSASFAWVCWRRKRLAAIFCKSSSTRRFSKGNVLELFTFAPAEDSVRIIPVVSDLEVESGLGEPEIIDRDVLLGVDDAATLHAPDGRSVEITGFDTDGATCWVNILSGGPYEQRRTTAKVMLMTATTVMLACIIVAFGIRHSPLVVEVVQFTLDALYLS